MNKKYDFLQYLVETMAENPSWVPEVFEAVTEGAKHAHSEMLRRLSAMRMGLVASMSFISDGESASTLRKISEDAILKAYEIDGGTSHLAPCERDALSKIHKAVSE